MPSLAQRWLEEGKAEELLLECNKEFKLEFKREKKKNF
jgi:hypothetical protein